MWLMIGWPEGRKDAEYAINEAGSLGASDEDADLALAPKESGLVTARCLRDEVRQRRS
jgi:hypothetical protein